MQHSPRFDLVRLHPRGNIAFATHGRTVFATGHHGLMSEPHEEQGLFVRQTRLLSTYQWLIDGKRPVPVAYSNIDQQSALGYYIALPPGMEPGPRDHGSGMVEHVSQHSLELKIGRYVGDSVHEDIDLRNYSQVRTRFRLELELDADFADPGELAAGERLQQGKLRREWRDAEGGWELVFDYHAEHDYSHQGESGHRELHRGLVVRVENAGSPPEWRAGRIRFEVELAPGARWHTCLRFLPVIEGERLFEGYPCYAFIGTHSEHDERRDVFLAECARFSVPTSDTMEPVVVGALEQARRDLAALRLYDMDHGERAWVAAAGLPIYVALFGRDTLTTAWEAALLTRDIMRGTLAELPRWQGAEVNDWRDEQPGKMLHEAHDGPLAMLGYNPRDRYYGAVTTSVFYPVVLAELWHWTGDKELVRPFVEPAMKGLQWAERYGDLNGDGFYDFQSRSAQGTRNQGWKDSSDAIVYEDGTQVGTPIATCEEQAYVYIAKLHMSEVMWWLGERDLAKQLYHEAEELKKRFNEVFWMHDLRYLAMGLDSFGAHIRSIGSDAGHCLAAGIVEKELVPDIARRMFAPDLFSGWGVRTLSSEHPAYNPYSYHRGSVWPVEHGTFAIAFLRYGLHDEVERIARGMFDAAELFDYYRLPEVFAGHPRDPEHPFPALYPRTNWPQAWSASAVFTIVQALLGIYPYAPLNVLLLDPHLPEWLPELTVSNVHVGEAVASIRFRRRQDGETDYEVLEQEGRLHVLRQASPWSLTTSFAERARDLISSLI